MTSKPIKTYRTEAFRQAYIKPEQLLKPGFEQFFIVRVEDMVRQMKLPVPPTRTDATSLIHGLLFLLFVVKTLSVEQRWKFSETT